MKNITFITYVFATLLFAQVERIEPPNWWVGMENSDLQLLVKESNIGSAKVSLDYKGVSIKKIHKADSPNYLLIDLTISKNAEPGILNLKFESSDGKTITVPYELKQREFPKEDYQGFNSSDAIYLITPDRFANANPKNDIDKNLKEITINRKDDYGRHGGDIQGITDNLDYIQKLGFTAIWPTPVLTNNMPRASYHGYAITDFYGVDPRFGTLEEYIQLSKEAEKRGIKLIQDQVVNHSGLNHWWINDLPYKDWLNYQPNFEQNKENWDNKTTINSNHLRTTNQDIYASDIDKEQMLNGWFVADMPDLNKRNPFMETYLIQNSIWWIESLKLGGIRQDTYPYSNKTFLANWAGSIMKEYPNFNIVGEEWSTNPLLISYWQDGMKNKDGYKSNLVSTMDFAMQNKIVEALNEEEAWDTGLIKIYEGLANDFIYPNPENILIFMDNHDMSRVFTQLKSDKTNTQMALSLILTMPRIPQIYYGTEIFMHDNEKPGDHGLIRSDFPGGWQGDATNAFTGENLSADKKDMQNYLTKILNYRKTSKAIQQGTTKHFGPKDGVYLLSRTFGNETVVLIMNKNKESYTPDLERFKELGLEGKTLKNIVTNETLKWDNRLTLNKKGSYLLTTK